MKLWIAAAIVGATTLGLTSTHVALSANDNERPPAYACSIKVAPKTPTSQLAALARISAAQAQTAANSAVPGTVVKSSIEGENGCLVYSVLTKAADGKLYDVKVDAGSGKVVNRESVKNGDIDRETNGENSESEGRGESEGGGEK
jgi:uncharacterized membrane protein YkoI